MSNPSGLCKCGCGARTKLARQSHTKLGWVRGEPIDYVRGHRGPQRYELRAQPWLNASQGRWYVDGRDGSRTAWARIVLQDSLGRPLNRREHAHHVNGDKQDDRIENLQVLESAEHTRLHNTGKRRPLLPKPPPPNPGGRCLCGCGQLTPRAQYTSRRDRTVHGEHLRFIHGHNGRLRLPPRRLQLR